MNYEGGQCRFLPRVCDVVFIQFLKSVAVFRDAFSLQPGQSPRFEYLVRLDVLSSPPVYKDCGTQPTCRVVEGQGSPQGFAKIRLQGEGAEQWAEFINASGFLRRYVQKELAVVNLTS